IRNEEAEFRPSRERHLIAASMPQPRIIEPGTPWLGRRSLELLVQRVEEFDIDIPLLRLHVPQVDGCTATYKRTTTEEGTWDVTFAILGVSESRLAKFEQEQMELTRATKHCLEVVQQGKVKVETGKLIYNGRTTPYLGTAFAISEIKPDMIFRTL